MAVGLIRHISECMCTILRLVSEPPASLPASSSELILVARASSCWVLELTQLQQRFAETPR